MIDERLRSFIDRCEAYMLAAKFTRSTLSHKLFNDGKRLDAIAAGTSDIGIGRLAAAERLLATMEGALLKDEAA